MLDFNKNEEGKDKMSDVVCEVIAQLPTKYGTFEAHGYVDQRSGEHHVALVKGDIADGEPVLCRVASNKVKIHINDALIMELPARILQG